mmetsp:Transcript_24991/g.56450  ORF Transcript_24991/g.56450 Transcript_24991/m.56450 type:complete len:139 (-) Transcript_24991:20-436(-)
MSFATSHLHLRTWKASAQGGNTVCNGLASGLLIHSAAFHFVSLTQQRWRGCANLHSWKPDAGKTVHNGWSRRLLPWPQDRSLYPVNGAVKVSDIGLKATLELFLPTKCLSLNIARNLFSFSPMRLGLLLQELSYALQF